MRDSPALIVADGPAVRTPGAFPFGRFPLAEEGVSCDLGVTFGARA